MGSVDIEEARVFFEAMYPQGVPLCFQVLDDPKRNGEGVKPEFRYGELEELAPWLKSLNSEGAGIFFMVNTGDGVGRSAANVKGITAVFVDLDGAPIEPVTNAKVKPHVIIESSPGKYHAYWRVSGCELEDFPPVQKALASKFGGDPAVNDIPRIMRVPGFLHQKDMSRPYQTRIVSQRYNPPYSLETLVSSLGLDVSKKPEYIPQEQTSGRTMFREGERNHALTRLAARLRNTNITEDAIRVAMQKENALVCDPPLPLSEINGIIKWVMGKEGSSFGKPMGNQDIKLPQVEILTWSDLHHREYPQPKWVIKDLLPTGLTVLAGRPSVGKSWLVQNLCLSVATGAKALRVFGVNQGRSLTLALEDTHQRYQHRMRLMLAGTEPPANAHFANAWSRLPHAVGHLENWIQNNREDCKLVIIDCLAKIRPRGGSNYGGGVYDKDYLDIEGLQQLAGKYDIAVILVHHERKGNGKEDTGDDLDRVSGSAGITGAADTIWLFSRKDRSEMKATLQVTGRDISDKKYGIIWDEPHGRWDCVSVNGSDLAEGAQKVLETFLGTCEGLSYKEVAERAGISVAASRLIVADMFTRGEVKHSEGDMTRYVYSDACE